MTTGIKLPKPRFLSTLSLRRATNPLWLMGYDVGFLSTLSLRRATYRSIDRNNVGKISIHALLAESDSMYTSLCCGCFDFYPRSPCGERPACQGPPLRGICISIHALLAESDAPQQENGQAATISIHALLAESDSLSSSSWGFMLISIHALLAESDIELAFLAINPITFLSTLSLRRATPGAKSTTPERYYFYPRSPCGERPVTARIIDPTYDFYPRSPCGERRRQRPGS